MLEKQENLTELAGKKVIDWDADQGIRDPETTTYRIRLGHEAWEERNQWQQWLDKFAAFLQDPLVSELNGLVIGIWDLEVTMEEQAPRIVEMLVAARERLPKLKALFLGDIIAEENEISWIVQTDVSPLFNSYPTLEYFGVRGGQNLRLGGINHEYLHTLAVEAGGLPREVVQDVMRSNLPALEHLELWLGTRAYGGTATVEDLTPLFKGLLFPHLRYLGLRDSEIANDLALAVAQAPLLERIEILDLSLGLLDDTGAEALLNSQAVRRLKKLDLHYHYCSEEMTARLLKEMGSQVDISERQEPHMYSWGESRYVSVSE